MVPTSTDEFGSFTWDLYDFELGGNPVNLGLSEGGGKAYFVLLISPAEEHDALVQELFIPAIEAMAPLE